MKNKAKIHDIVQINQYHEWVGCLVYVTELKRFGVQGFVSVPNQGCAYIRLKEEEYDVIGQAVMQIEIEKE